MGRLIDADLLKKNIAKWLQGSDPQETQMVKLDDIAISVIMEIDEQPTAYDVEKVVEEEENFLVNYGIPKNTAVHRKIIGIIRKGGVG